jgi:hypothetical protein
VLVKRRAVVLEIASWLVEAAGVGVVGYGGSLVYRPFGWILAGLFLILVGLALAKAGAKEPERGPEYR